MNPEKKESISKYFNVNSINTNGYYSEKKETDNKKYNNNVSFQSSNSNYFSNESKKKSDFEDKNKTQLKDNKYRYEQSYFVNKKNELTDSNYTNQDSYFDQKKNYQLNNNEYQNKSSYFDKNKKDLTKNYYRKDFVNSSSFPDVNSIHSDAKIFRIEKYGIFVYFDQNKYEGMIHISKLLNKKPEKFNIDEIVTVRVSEIKHKNKIGLILIEDSNNNHQSIDNNIPLVDSNENFPQLSKSKNTVECNNIWANNNLEKIKKIPIDKVDHSLPYVFCKCTRERINIESAIKCQENEDSEIYYFKSYFHIQKFNNINKKNFKIVGKNGKLEHLPSVITANFNRNKQHYKSEIYNNNYSTFDSNNFNKDYDNYHIHGDDNDDDYDDDDDDNIDSKFQSNYHQNDDYQY